MLQNPTSRQLVKDLDQIRTSAGLDAFRKKHGATARKAFNDRSFLARVLKLERRTPDSLQKSSTHNGLVDIVNVDRDDAAVVHGWVDGVKHFSGNPRAEIPFSTVRTPEFSGDTMELLAAGVPFRDVFAKLGADLADTVDEYFVRLAKMCVAHTGNFVLVEGAFGREHLRRGGDLLRRVNKSARTMLGSSITANDLFSGDGELAGNLLSGVTGTGLVLPRLVVGQNLRPFTVNPFAPTDMGAVAFVGGHAADPAHPIGVNLSGKIIGGNAKNGKYAPSGTLLNGRFTGAGGRNASAPTTSSWGGNASFFFVEPAHAGKYEVVRDLTFYFDQRFHKLTWMAETLLGMGIPSIASVGMVVKV